MILKGKKYQNKSDHDLIEAYRKTGQNKWAGALFSRYAHLAYGTCLKYFKNEDRAKEAVMTLFEKLLSDLKTKEINDFRPWLYVVTKNHCLMALRRESREPNFHEELPELSEQDDESVVQKEEKLVLLEESIDKLKEDQATCIRLFYLQQKTYAEISESTGFTIKKVKSHLQNGKRNLQIMMKE